MGFPDKAKDMLLQEEAKKRVDTGDQGASGDQQN
jgi:hypothetical protein